LFSIVCKPNVAREDRSLLLEEKERIEFQQILEIMGGMWVCGLDWSGPG